MNDHIAFFCLECASKFLREYGLVDSVSIHRSPMFYCDSCGIPIYENANSLAFRVSSLKAAMEKLISRNNEPGKVFFVPIILSDYFLKNCKDNFANPIKVENGNIRVTDSDMFKGFNINGKVLTPISEGEIEVIKQSVCMN